MFVESIISIARSDCNYYISSEEAWICGIESYKIYQMLQLVSQKREATYEKMLMGVNLFHYLDKE